MNPLSERDEADARPGAENALRRVLDFLAVRDVERDLTAEEREAWRADLQKYQPEASYSPAGRTPEATLALLAGIQSAVSTGMRGLLRGGGWLMPSALLVVHRRQKSPPRQTFRLEWQPTDERGAIVAGIADLVRRVGETLRECAAPSCPGGPRLFLGRKRATFCSSTCQQRENNRRKSVMRKAARHRAKGGK
jgi:hypothetical protein